jgi:glycosyltransferase 2 family protein
LSLRPFGRLLRILIVVAVTAYVLWRARPGAVLDVLVRADLRWIGLAVALVVVDRTLMAYRWIVLLCPIDRSTRPPLSDVIRIFFVSSFAGTFLPASIGGDVVRAFGLSQLRVAPGQAVASVLMDRLLGVVSILIMGIIGLMLAQTQDLASIRSIEVPLLVTAVVSAGAAAVVFNESAASLAESIALRLPIAIVRRLATDLTRATRAYGRHHTELANVLLGSLGVQVLRIVQAYCLGRALGINLSVLAYFAFVPLILLVMLLPVSINGIGPSQVAFVWFFGRAGVPDAQSFALSVLFVALGIVGNLPGGLIYAFGSRAKIPARNTR